MHPISPLDQESLKPLPAILNGIAWPVESLADRSPASPPVSSADGTIIGIAGAALDLTERKRMEQALRHNENRLRTTCKHAPIGIAEVNLQGILLDANPKFCAQLGYPPEALRGRAITDLLHPAEVEAVRSACQRLLHDNAESVSTENRYIHQAGHVVWMSLTLSLVRDQEGSGMFGLAIAQDITDRKRADDARRQLAAIVESSEDAIVSINPDGDVQTWNRGAELMFGFNADEMIHQPITRIIPPDARPEALERLQRVTLCGETEHYDTVRLHRDGGTLHVALAVSPLCDASGTVVGISEITRDITREKQAAMQEHLLYTLVASVNRADALEDIYEAALNALCQSQQTARASILLFDESDVMRFAASRGLSKEYRRAVEEHSPWTASDADPRPICIEDVATFAFSPALRRAIDAEGIRALAFIPLTYENRLIGKLMVYFDTARPIHPEDLRVAETISRQVGIAIGRQRTASALEALVASRTASLQEAIQQMEEFSYSVSHDLRAPIRTMIVYAEMILSDHAEKLDDEVQRFLDRILKNARRMDALVRDTLAYSKLARREISLTAVPLARLIDDVIAALDLPAGRPAITCSGLSNTVLAHEPSLVQAVTNLLRNALKFVAPGVAPSVEVWSESDTGRVRLWVKDNGIGIPPEWQARLFGMFERLHGDRNYEGTGIGLAMVRKAIERMGGRVGVNSDGVHGSQFWIELPAVTNE